MTDIREIKDFAAPELDCYARLSELQLKHYYEPAEGLFIAESEKVIGRALDAGYEALSFLVEKRQLNGEAKTLLTRCPGVPVYTAELSVLTKLTGFQLTRGVLCAMRRKPLPDVRTLCAGASRIAILENVMNPTNVGAVFRSAAALGMDAVLLTPGCSDPLYRRASRVSMGTVFQAPWTFFDEKAGGWFENGMALLHTLGFQTVSLALRNDSVTLTDPCLKAAEKLAVIVGSEGEGLCAETIAKSDYVVRIDMAHGVDSLNANQAASIAFWELGKAKK